MRLSYRLLLLLVFLTTGVLAYPQDDSAKKDSDSVHFSSVNMDTAVVENEDDGSDALPADTAVTSIYRQIDTDTLALIKRDKGFYYQSWLDSLLRAKEAAGKKDDKPNPDFDKAANALDVFFSIFQIALWVIAAAILLFVIYKLTAGNNSLFLRTRKNIAVTVDKEEAAADGQYEGLIKKAEAESNYRLAVRYLHLQLLHTLGDKAYLTLTAEKTNYQYANELRNKFPALIKPFSALTYKYEYIWYGEYSISQTMYQLLKQEFNEFNKTTA